MTLRQKSRPLETINPDKNPKETQTQIISFQTIQNQKKKFSNNKKIQKPKKLPESPTRICICKTFNDHLRRDLTMSNWGWRKNCILSNDSHRTKTDQRRLNIAKKQAKIKAIKQQIPKLKK
jgi:hypothetical protein